MSALGRLITWKLIRVFKIKNYVGFFWGNRKINIQYNSFHSMWLMYNCWVDWVEFNLIKNYVSPGDTVADVGANMGYYSLWMSRFTGTTGKVIAFEPDAVNFKRLKNNISINHLSNNIEAVKKAVGNIDGNISFTTGMDGENHIAQNNNENITQVASVKPDSFFAEKNIEHIVYMKIDVEGFELEVLRGSLNYLMQKKIEIIQLEINQTISNSGASVNELSGFLQMLSYTLCFYDVKSNQLQCLQDNQPIENYFAVFDLEKANEKLRKYKD